MRNFCVIICITAFLALNIFISRRFPGAASAEQEFVQKLSEQNRGMISMILWFKIDQYHHSFSGEKPQTDFLPLLHMVEILTPHFIDAWTLHGYHAYTRLNKKDEALNALKTGIEKNPDSERLNELYGLLGYLNLVKEKNYESAWKELLQAILLSPDDSPDDKDSFLYRKNYLRMLALCARHLPMRQQKTIEILKNYNFYELPSEENLIHPQGVDSFISGAQIAFSDTHADNSSEHADIHEHNDDHMHEQVTDRQADHNIHAAIASENQMHKAHHHHDHSGANPYDLNFWQISPMPWNSYFFKNYFILQLGILVLFNIAVFFLLYQHQIKR